MDVWTYPDLEVLGENIRNTDVTGYGVEALNGSIGKVDEARLLGVELPVAGVRSFRLAGIRSQRTEVRVP